MCWSVLWAEAASSSCLLWELEATEKEKKGLLVAGKKNTEMCGPVLQAGAASCLLQLQATGKGGL